MDPTTIIGIILGFGLVVLGIISSDAGIDFKQINNFFDPQSIYITLGGTLSALVIAFPLKTLISIPKYIKKLILPDKLVPYEYITTIVDIAFMARKNGLLSLEERANDYPDPFMKNGLMLIVDSTDPEMIRNIMESELDSMVDRHKQGQAFFEKAGAYAPAFGMVGTLIGLINMLASMEDPDSLSKNMGIALITTFYGSILANIVFIPIANKLKERSAEEQLCKRLVIEGILAIQAGENPKQIQEKLLSFLPAGKRDLEKATKGKNAGGAETERK